MPKKSPKPSPALKAKVSARRGKGAPSPEKEVTRDAMQSGETAGEILQSLLEDLAATVKTAPASEVGPADPPETPAAPGRAATEVFDPAQHHEEIAQTAYYLWLERGGAHGSPEDDWRRAEEQVRSRYVSAAS
jgi:hypothetical protein